jgi:two-component system sensor histidine kinase/response regulator
VSPLQRPESVPVINSPKTGLSSQLLHDLRSPLTQIIGYSEMLTEEAEGQRRDGFVADLDRIRNAGRRMLLLIEESFTSIEETTVMNEPEEEEEPPALVTPNTPQPLFTAGHLLVVDDDAANRDVLSRRLKRQGHEVRTANNGRDALQLMRTTPFDIVLLDIMMPDMDGYEVLGRINGDERLRHIPVIMISAINDVQSVVRCIEAGAADYLAKPFNSTILKARIDACLEKKRGTDRETALFEQLQKNYKKLQEVEKLRDDMRNMIVHDLRTPLTAVIVGVEMLEKHGELNEAQREMMAIASGGGKTLLRMINDLLDVEKMESGSTQLQYTELAAEALIVAAVGQVASLAEEGRITLVTEIGDRLPPFLGDEDKLSRTLVNLIANAIKFTREGSVTIAASWDGRKNIRFTVRDTGDGIPAEAFERIFDKFGQLESRSRVGTGLGLTFCKLAVEAHGGEISVESTVGVGSTFCFTIPVVSVAPLTEVQPCARKRILVTDDDASIRALITAVLSRADPTYDVDTAANGREALEKIAATRYDVVVLDLMMPEVTGMDVIARLEPREPQPRFVVVMSAASKDFIAKAVGLNVFASLRKPFNIEEMIATVSACIAGPIVTG